MRLTDVIWEQIEPPTSVLIMDVRPMIDCGRFPIKREIGDTVTVSADIVKDGHDRLAAVVRYRKHGESCWSEADMRLVDNDRWEGSFAVDELGRYEYTITAFPDRFASWQEEISKKIGAGLDVALEIEEGRLLIETAMAEGPDPAIAAGLLAVVTDPDLDQATKVARMLDQETTAVMRQHRVRRGATTLERPLEVVVDRVKARYAAWYEIFPRSAGTSPGQSGTFDDVIARLPYIQGMGFDVLYFPPIHPIGTVNRKGPNNTLRAGPDDPGVPYAIGNATGGHDAIEPALGTLEDFARLREAARAHGLELALDFAIQAAPDHPWAAEHPEWFTVRPDGSIKFAENPPKRYEDIYPINFDSSDWQGLWHEMLRIVRFWIEQGVKIYRVDNPHTKPTIFWEWLIAEVQRTDPDVIFLSEAFTRPKVMKSLAKAGFTQSYTYFTWRNFKAEIIDYFTELTGTEVAEYMRGNLFVNTPDILPTILQQGGRPAFKMRLLLAATLSSVYGLYSGYELCENTPVPGKEEYLNSEKYDYKVWDWDRPGNIIEYVTLINRIRAEHPALHEYDNLRFYAADDPDFLCYGKATTDGRDGVLIVVNVDPFQPHETMFHFPVEDFGFTPDEPYVVTELITGQSFVWTGGTHHVYLDPTWEPGLVYAIHRPVRDTSIDVTD